MEKLKETLITLLPLLLILVVSWLFSLMGSKLKGKNPEDQPAQKESEDQQPDLIQILTGTKEKTTPDPSGFHGIDSGFSPHGTTNYRPSGTGGPTVTTKPIKPKWWGA